MLSIVPIRLILTDSSSSFTVDKWGVADYLSMELELEEKLEELFYASVQISIVGFIYTSRYSCLYNLILF